MRRNILLGDATQLIEDLNSKTLSLSEQLAQKEQELIRIRLNEEHIERVKKIVTERVEFKPIKALKR